MTNSSTYTAAFEALMRNKADYMAEWDQFIMGQGMAPEQRFEREAVDAVEAYLVSAAQQEVQLQRTTEEWYYMGLAYVGECIAFYTEGAWALGAEGTPVITNMKSNTDEQVYLTEILRPTFEEKQTGHWQKQIGLWKIHAGHTLPRATFNPNAPEAEQQAETKKAQQALVDAVSSGNVEVIKLLLNHNLPLYFKDEQGLNLLEIAVMGNQLEAAWVLLDHGFELQEEQATARMLIKAIEYQNTTLVKLLLDAGALPDMPWLEAMQMPLAKAVELNDEAMVTLLLAHDADANILNELGLSPIALASENHNRKMVEQLLEAGANINAEHVDGSTPLVRAVYIGNPDAVAHLLSLGADSAIGTMQGKTALEIAQNNAYEHQAIQEKIIALLQ